MKFIGQAPLKFLIDMQIEHGNFSRFTIISGETGSGKHEMVKYIHENLSKRETGLTIYEADNTVEAVRKVITDAHKSFGTPILYVFYNADTMSPSAKNALLKLTEEPPKNAYIIMTVTNSGSIMDTLLSRASVYYMTPYNLAELTEYTKEHFPGEETSGVCEICSTPGEINEVERVCDGKAVNLLNYVETIINKINDVTIANAFKMADRIAMKDTDTNKYSLRAVFRAVNHLLLSKIVASEGDTDYDVVLDKWGQVIEATTNCINTLDRTPTISKMALLDLWIIKIRAILDTYEEEVI